jgi:5-methyltetrahydrofolate--homocysteine methyltransferase
MITRFISIGENIHCTRILKREGKSVVPLDGGRFGIAFEADGTSRVLPIPEPFLKSGDWENGKVKHCAAAIWQGVYGKGPDRDLGVAYLRAQAARQEKHGATFLDVNVDEFSTDVEERVRLMRWTADVVQKASSLPLSIDTSSEPIMRAGLEACDKSRGRPMVNSISLERIALLPLMAEFKPAVVASAAGETDLPCTVEGRLENLDRLMPQLEKQGIRLDAVHVDPLVFPISTDPANGKSFLDSVKALRAKYGPEIHLIGGLSNISFGMPNRKLINQVFTHLAVEFGADGGIVDPLQINLKVLQGLDTASESYRLARALLLGEDEFGMEFIAAHREGRLPA